MYLTSIKKNQLFACINGKITEFAPEEIWRQHLSIDTSFKPISVSLLKFNKVIESILLAGYDMMNKDDVPEVVPEEDPDDKRQDAINEHYREENPAERLTMEQEMEFQQFHELNKEQESDLTI